MRLFVAIDTPAALKGRVRQLQGMLPSSFRLVDPETFHLTLKFLGEVREEKLEKVEAALAAVPFTPFRLATTRLGTFPGSFWLGVRLSSELAQLQQAVERAVREFALRDPRSYKPHLTLARYGSLTAEDGILLKTLLKERLKERWKVDSFTLYRSTLTPAGPRYEAVARFPA